MFLFGFCGFVQKLPKRNANTLHFLFYRKILQEVKGEVWRLKKMEDLRPSSKDFQFHSSSLNTLLSTNSWSINHQSPSLFEDATPLKRQNFDFVSVLSTSRLGRQSEKKWCTSESLDRNLLFHFSFTAAGNFRSKFASDHSGDAAPRCQEFPQWGRWPANWCGWQRLSKLELLFLCWLSTGDFTTKLPFGEDFCWTFLFQTKRANPSEALKTSSAHLSSTIELHY